MVRCYPFILLYRLKHAPLTHQGLYISDLPNRSLEDDFIAFIFGRVIPVHCVKVNDTCNEILELDLVRAWKETDSKAGWSNEVAVEVVIR